MVNLADRMDHRAEVLDALGEHVAAEALWAARRAFLRGDITVKQAEAALADDELALVAQIDEVLAWSLRVQRCTGLGALGDAMHDLLVRSRASLGRLAS